MLIAVFLTFVLTMGWVLLDSRTTKDVIKLHFVIGMFAIWGTYLFLKLESWSPLTNRYIYLICIPVFGLLLWKVYKTAKHTGVDIVAKQQSYWGIPSGIIYEYYKNRIAKKDDRIEANIDTATKSFRGNNTSFSGNIAFELKAVKLTKVASIAEIKNIELFSLVFAKITNILKQMEKNIDLEESLRENDMCVEYLLLDLRERFTRNFNLGAANLDIYAKTDTQREFVGALDSICLSSVKRNGALLLYLFLKFKNRVPSSNNNQ
jgi:hypothetical protein